ncbi:hypothetical protein ENBRE01_0547 [Enteropsectra breve]|nr:hypothetical protein ENBRE01_0547 [Enteropsectra breve]
MILNTGEKIEPSNDKRLASFNRLIYEYLIKINYTKSATIFKDEASLEDIQLTDSPPSLLNWYCTFIETAEVRSGRKYIPESLNRIEAIMLRFENEKAKFVKLGIPGPFMPAPKHSNYERQAETRKRDRPQYKDETSSFAEKYPPSPSGKSDGFQRCGQGKETRQHSSVEVKSPQMCPQPTPPSYPGNDKQNEFNIFSHQNMREKGNFPECDHSFRKGEEQEYTVPKYRHLIEDSIIELQNRHIVLSYLSKKFSLLISICGDGRLYFFNLRENKNESKYDLGFVGGSCKFFEIEDLLYIAIQQSENNVVLIKYAKRRCEEIKNISGDTAIISFCFGFNSLLVLYASRMLASYYLSGDLNKTVKVSSGVLAVEFFINNVLLIEKNQVVEFDFNLNIELKIMMQGHQPRVFIKGSLAIIVFSDAIHVFDSESAHPIFSIKSTLRAKDVIFIGGKLAVIAGDELFYGSDIIHAPAAVAVSDFSITEKPNIITVCASGIALVYAVK